MHRQWCKYLHKCMDQMDIYFKRQWEDRRYALLRNSEYVWLTSHSHHWNCAVRHYILVSKWHKIMKVLFGAILHIFAQNSYFKFINIQNTEKVYDLSKNLLIPPRTGPSSWASPIISHTLPPSNRTYCLTGIVSSSGEMICTQQPYSPSHWASPTISHTLPPSKLTVWQELWVVLVRWSVHSNHTVPSHWASPTISHTLSPSFSTYSLTGIVSSSSEIICTQQPYSPFTLSFPDRITYSTTFIHYLQFDRNCE